MGGSTAPILFLRTALLPRAMTILIAPLLFAANCVTPTCKPPAAPLTLRNAAAIPRPPDPTIVLKFAGPTIPIAAVPPSLGWYEQRFKQYADEQWRAFGPKWDAGNSISGYERAAIYYVWWARTGDATYLTRAHETAVDYRDKYLIPGGYAASPHWSQMESLYLDWLVFGDTKSRDAVIEVANRLVAFPQSGYFAIPQGEPRIQARVILSLWLAEKIEGKRRPMLDTAIVRTLSTMNADGWAPFQSTCGGSLNYMNGMLYDVLTRIYDQRAGSYNSAILTKVTAFGNYLWNSQWRGAKDPSFNYVSLLCDGTGGPTSAPDLNGLIVPVFGWLGKTTGDKTWFDRGDQVFNGMQNASAYLYRQFSESYTSSYRYLGYRYGTK